MANKDLVLTEDSPGTVEALAKGSDYFKNLRIEGGVNLGVESNYVCDSQALRAINEAVSRYGSAKTTASTASYKATEPSLSGRSFSFDLDGKSYSVVPQHSLTSGKDRREIRYQTDIAFRDAGFCLTEEALAELQMDTTRMIVAQAAGPSPQPSAGASEEETLRWYQTLQEQAAKQARPIQERLSELQGRKYASEQEFAQAIDKVLADHEGADWIKPMVIRQAYYYTILELVRYFNPKQRGVGEFGEGWRLMVPYRIHPAGTARKELNGVLVPERMTVQNLVTGDSEILAFSTDRYSVVGYVPDSVGKSQVVGLFIMSDGSSRLADKLGNEFWFDPAGRLSDMILSERHRTHFEYADGLIDSFDQVPYRIEPAGRERVEFRGVSLPKTMMVVDSTHSIKETLLFDPNGRIVGYVPENRMTTSFQILALMSDVSFRLLDRNGNEVAFGPDGRFVGLSPSSDNLIVKSVRVGPYKVDFGYTMGPSGSPMIASAQLSKEGAPETVYAVRYEYDNEGRLCRTIPQQNQLAQNDPFPTGNRNANATNSMLLDCRVGG
jgi:hypothetical protein